MANNNHPDYLESLFQGIDIILEKRLDAVSFDTTIICTIVDDSNRKNGEYKVTDGSVTYKAYSDLDNYVAGQQVRVSVPMGDFSQKKFIIGKYVSDNDASPITYVSPLDSVVNMSGNLVPLNKTASITANGSERNVIIWNQRLDSGNYVDLQANGIYNTIILKADFKTLLANYDLAAGTYGLRLDLLVRPSVESTGRIRRYVELSSKEMFGNPYAFSIFSPQAKTFNISTVGIIEGIELSLYQNGDFKDRLTGPISPNPLTPDIIVNNIQVGFGSDITETDDNVVKIYAENGLTYKYHNATDNTNLKKLGLLWYNKDDNNTYVGFSDGIYSPEYDELEYIELSRMDTRLLAQKGRDGIPTDKDSLNLAANIEEATPLIIKARDIINQDLNRILLEFRQQVIKVNELTAAINKLVTSSGEHYLLNYSNAITTAFTDTAKDKCGMVEQYAGVLDFARDTQEQLTGEQHSTWNSLWEVNYAQIILNNFQAVRDAILGTSGLFAEMEPHITGPSARYGGYKGVFDVYTIRIKRILTTMDEYLGMSYDENGVLTPYNKYFPVDVLNGVDFTLLQTYQTKTNFKAYQEQDLSAYHNKYCIYWYRYEKGYKNADQESLMPDGWRRLTLNDFYRIINLDADVYLKNKYYIYDNTSQSYVLATGDYNQNAIYYEKTTDDQDFVNVGLSGQYFDENNNPVKNDEGKPLHAIRPAPGQGMFSRFMQYDIPEEKYAAIVFYNHNMYKSNELVFTNEDVIPDKTTLDKGDILIFEHGENSQDNFQVYTELTFLQDAADEQKARRIRCHYDGLLAKDEALVNAGIYWYVPINATMLAYDKDYLVNRGFTTDIDIPEAEKPSYSKSGYACFYKQISAQKMCSKCENLYSECTCEEKNGKHYWDYTNGSDFDNRDFWYKIQPKYEETSSQNNLMCEVHIQNDDDPVHGEQLFTFGIAGTNGTKYTLDILNTSTQVAVTETEGLSLSVTLRDAAGEMKTISTAASAAGLQVGEAYNCRANWLFLRNEEKNLPSLQLTPIGGTNVTGLTVSAGNFGIIELKCSFKMPDENDNEKSRLVDLDCLQAIPWSADTYYISGPTTIVYNNYGTLDNTSMYDVPYKLFLGKDICDENGSIITEAHSEVAVDWDIKYYIKDGNNFIELIDVPITQNSTLEDIKKHNNYVLYSQYLPVINDAGGLTPSTLYLDNMECFAVVRAKNGNSILWEQPIIIVQNRYASTMLNSWDGSLTIDEKNGTILSTMIGAGRKSSNNTFEGVLMGDVAIGTNSNIGFEKKNDVGFSNMTGLGIYGFHDGAQSFGFNIDGTAFLGKAGAGRILFSGNYGVIASANWFTGSHPADENDPFPGGGKVNETGITRASTAGMCIDLQSGHIDAYDFKITSSTLHFNSNPQDIPEQGIVGYYMRIGNDGRTRVDYAQGLSWVSNDDYAALATPGYLALDAHGNLTIRVNSLYLTEQLGGANLLRQTAPVKSIPVEQGKDSEGNSIFYKEDGTIDYLYNVFAWQKKDEVAVDGAENVGPAADLKNIVVKVNNSDYTIYQNIVKSRATKKYTFSGWICAQNADEGTLTLNLYNLDDTGNPIADSSEQADQSLNTNTITFTKNEWTYFEYTASIITGYTSLQAEFKGTCDFYLWHAKLEEGSIATTWCPAKNDVDEDMSNTQNKYDLYLSQDAIFNKLIKDPITGNNMVGIWMVPIEDSASGKRKELYINATYISTGILRSNNWNGTLTPTKITDTVTGTEHWTYTLTQHATNPQGVYFNLNEGKIWAAKFELTAGSTLYLNSHPGASQSYFRVGTNDYFLNFDSSGKLTLKVTNFDLIAGSGNNTIKITSNSSQNPIDVGNGQFKVTWAGKLIAQSAEVHGSIYADYIEAITGGKIGGWTISKNSLSSGKGEINGTNGTMTFGESGAQGNTYFSVSNAGFLKATGAELDTLTVKNSLTVPDSGDVMIDGKCIIGGTTVNDKYQCEIAGTTYMSGALTIKTGRIYFTETPTETSANVDVGEDYFYVNGGNWFWAKANYIKMGPNEGGCQMGIGASPQKTSSGTSLNIGGEVCYKGDIYCDSYTEENRGKDLDTCYLMSNIFGGVKLTFKKGILVKMEDMGFTSTGDSTDGGSKIPSLSGNANKFLQVASTGTKMQWTTLYAPTTTGTDGQVWTSTGSGGAWESVPATTWSNLSGKPTSFTPSSHTHGGGDITSAVSSASYASKVARGTATQTYVTTQGTDSSGACYRGPTVSSLSGDSSRRFKHDIHNLVNSESLYKLQPVSYYYNDEAVLGSNKRYGFIAEDVLPLAPELVEMNREDNTLCQAIYYNSILTLAVAEIQKLRKELDVLKSNLNI